MNDDLEQLERQQPYDLAAEQAVLGAMLLDRDHCRQLLGELTPGEYYRPLHATIHQAIAEVTGRGEVADPITVGPVLAAMGGRLPGPTYLLDLVQAVPAAASGEYYAQIVRRRAAARDAIQAGQRLAQAGYQSTAEDDTTALVERAIEDLRAVRDRTMRGTELEPPTLAEFLAEADDEPDWVIPGVLARWDRLIVTGEEGGGKSLLIRQLLMRAAAGLHPWRKARIRPVKVLLIDVENSKSQARPWLRRMAAAAAEEGGSDPSQMFIPAITQKPLDLSDPGDRAWLLRQGERVQPDLIGIGPIYKLTSSGKNDEEAARPVVTALENLRTATDGAALLIEGHSPHTQPGARQRDLRPIGSTIWRRWPEYGFGLSPVPESREPGAKALRLVDWEAWRGPRSQREWPYQLIAGATWPWQALDRPADEQPVGLHTVPAARTEEPAVPDDESWQLEWDALDDPETAL